MTIIAFLRPLLLRGHRRLAELPPQHNYCIKTPLSVTVEGQDTSAREFRNRLATGPGFPDFLKRASAEKKDPQLPQADVEDTHSYFPEASLSGDGRKVYFETYGCQMNVSDTEIAWSILQRRGYLRTKDPSQADVILLVTCSVREKAEQTIWNKLRQLATLKQKRPKTQSPLKLGVLGCMAERLKTELLEREKLVDVLAGPDAYRDLPRLLSVAHGGLRASNVLLSLEETYADVMPVHRTPQGHSAFVSVMRGCDNMCSYCIVPFTRGRERSRPIASILEEVRLLLDQGVREVTLLGQNVNSYRDTSVQQLSGVEPTRRSRGFSALYRDRQGGLRFADLLDRVSLVDPEMRVRFTSPHPKDFPDEVLQLIQERGNICKQIHLPAQSGSSRVLQAMRRGYTREAYLELVAHIRGIIPENPCLPSAPGRRPIGGKTAPPRGAYHSIQGGGLKSECWTHRERTARPGGRDYICELPEPERHSSVPLHSELHRDCCALSLWNTAVCRPGAGSLSHSCVPTRSRESLAQLCADQEQGVSRTAVCRPGAGSLSHSCVPTRSRDIPTQLIFCPIFLIICKINSFI
ncbi:mitochondrial tRNA methylthiotransferase CDK5RAP1 isoform X3 [Lepisosteus oculatus]|uniref:mitochondrial tRNA methylthiotransferase CDK5RAP1 isoform X3 n=1 Tax=Lepisosteus oculatus TaxID=7918 RepID=UPI0035F50BD5